MKYVTLAFLILSTSLLAADEKPITLQGISVTGDKELPRVLYIVPWQAHTATPITAPDYKSVLDEPFIYIKKTD